MPTSFSLVTRSLQVIGDVTAVKYYGDGSALTGIAGGGGGTQGTQGEQGIQGTRGTQGQQGITGNQGIQGQQGITGSGAQGTQGRQGITGAQGIQGNTGAGTQGTQGQQGITGSQGTQGEQGIQGTQGQQGITGTQGTQGQQGITGTQGTQGQQGITGSGAQGTQGQQGITGAGTQGITGAQGIQGNTGAGTQGTQGQQGIQGIQGVKGTKVTAAATPPTSPSVNDFWWNSDYGVLMVYYDDGDSQQWVSAMSGITGIQGTAGSSGSSASIDSTNDVSSNSTFYPVIVAGSGAQTAKISSTKFTFNPSTGDLAAAGNVTAYFSDDRLKDRQGNITNALEKVNKLNGFYFIPNDTAVKLGYTKRMDVGISAQEAEIVLPEVVVPAQSNSEYLTVRYERLIPLLIESIKEMTLDRNYMLVQMACIKEHVNALQQRIIDLTDK